MTDKIDYTEVVVCLCDGEYHNGVAALANSLAKSEFKGLIHVGYRGRLPPWVRQLEAISEKSFYVTKEIVLHFKRVDIDMHLGYYKPFFIKETFDIYSNTQKIYYFDADIITSAPWVLFSNWLEKGVCLCLDSAFHFLHHNHPWRKDWRRLAAADELVVNNTNHYFNSGFIGLERESILLIDRWIFVTKKYIEKGGNIDSFSKDAFSSFKGDQDLLNAAITISPEIDISIMGKEGMGFTHPATVMMHAIGHVKPWNNKFLIHLIISGRKPNIPEQTFFSYCKYPICIFSPFLYNIKKLDLVSASFLGRFLG
ncbi:MAG: hypothetical protein H7Z13_21540 [Ferruginibacter sp.]|nr:hypothetical protein [Ferruginibacter sp.]